MSDVDRSLTLAVTRMACSWDTGANLDRAEADRETKAVLTATVDLSARGRHRRAWGVFRDRRPDLYGALAGLDGAGT